MFKLIQPKGRYYICIKPFLQLEGKIKKKKKTQNIILLKFLVSITCNTEITLDYPLAAHTRDADSV